MNLDNLLNQFLSGSGPGNHPAQGQQPAGGALGGLSGSLPKNLRKNIPGGLTGGLAAGGLLGLLVGNKKVRKTVGKVAGSAVTMGGAAVLGVLAYNAYNNWRSGASAQQAGSAPVPEPNSPAPQLLNAPSEENFAPANLQTADQQPFQLVLVKAMIAAANADGHIDGDEQKAIFEAVERFELASDEKALIFDTLRNPPNISAFVAQSNGLEQASEIYLASRLAIDVDVPVEREYLKSLAEALALPADFVAHLESQVAEAS